jgi:hypothetical protein
MREFDDLDARQSVAALAWKFLLKGRQLGSASYVPCSASAALSVRLLA